MTRTGDGEPFILRGPAIYGSARSKKKRQESSSQRHILHRPGAARWLSQIRARDSDGRDSSRCLARSGLGFPMSRRNTPVQGRRDKSVLVLAHSQDTDGRRREATTYGVPW
jgi:hypothetical protein